MNSRTHRLLLLIVCGLFVGLAADASETETVYLSGHGPEDAATWDFFCTGGRNSGTWTTIPVPSCWEQQGFGTYNYGVLFRKERDRPNPPPLADEQGLYRHDFTVPAGWKGRRVRIVFDGVMTDAEVRINGTVAGPVHQGSFYRFHYDITRLLHFGGTNRLEVTVSKKSANESVNRAERLGDYWDFGGIFRPVWLEARPAQAIDWTGIDARADGSFAAEVHIDGAAAAAGTLGTEIVAVDGATVADLHAVKFEAGATTVEVHGVVDGVRLWTAETPHLYTARFTMSESGREPHVVMQRFGFRTFEVRPEDGLYLNGVKIRLKGVDRHCFWPETGRTLSRAQSFADARLIKEMNMNAVRASHYPPDADFLEACDELGIYVLDELAGWHGAYDTPTAMRLVGEMVRRDVNHPSILFWDNGNEGGWNTDVDGDFAKWDPQHRPVLHPWEKFSGVDTNHYEPWDSHLHLTKGPMIYMPTEVLHGLYDGGQGSGLHDYWNAVIASPTAAGMFLWSFADEGVVRTDENGRIDCEGNLAPDGIVGPHHEREGSFYAVKEIWSPVQLDLPETLPADWDGSMGVTNRYDFTRLGSCSVHWALLRNRGPESTALEQAGSGTMKLPDVAPHETGSLQIPLPDDHLGAGIVHVTVIGPKEDELWTWSATIGATAAAADSSPASEASTEGLKPVLIAYRREGRKFAEVPMPDAALAVEWHALGDNSWRLDYRYTLDGTFDIVGVRLLAPGTTFKSKRWLGRGPYRVWQNRMGGGVLDIHALSYDESTPGRSWSYPEFNGYFRDWRWLTLETTDGRMTVGNISGVPFFGLGMPHDGDPPMMTFPDVGFAVLDVIPAMGSKFTLPDRLGPQSQPRTINGVHSGSLIIRVHP